MVQVYRHHGTDRKIEVSYGKQLLRLNFKPDVEEVENKPSEVLGALYEAKADHELGAELLPEAQGKGKTEKEALLDLVGKLSAKAKEAQKEALVAALEQIKGKIIAEGIGFSRDRYVPYSERTREVFEGA
ncbi:hypothetical protein FAI40_03500 [Acetobacteraceae bacterium]|nr:hypothetical protein FAI40_03500 [Acetobacteraceae bacterium]